MNDGEKKRLVLIDGHSVLFRAYYAIPFLTSPAGEQVNAVYGFASTLLSVIEELEPTHIAVAFDSRGPTKRKEEFDAYKAQRKEPPEELIAQIEPTKEVVAALNVPSFAVQGYEADDLIGTIATQASSKVKGRGVEVVIVTGDKDLLQLVDDGSTSSPQGKVKVYIPGRLKKPSVMFDEERVVEELGLEREQVPDMKGLAGDSSDNIPGVKGIGPKTAVKLLRKLGTVEEVYKALDGGKLEEMVGKAVVNKLTKGREMAELSKRLATIMTDAPIKFDLEACLVSSYDKDETAKMFEKLGFKSLMARLPDDEYEQSVQEALF